MCIAQAPWCAIWYDSWLKQTKLGKTSSNLKKHLEIITVDEKEGLDTLRDRTNNYFEGYRCHCKFNLKLKLKFSINTGTSNYNNSSSYGSTNGHGTGTACFITSC